MAITDQEVLDEIQETLIETQDSGATWSSGFWTVSEVIGYLNDVQYDFLKKTLLLVTPTTLNTIPNTRRHALPQDWIATYDAAFKSSAATPVYSPLSRSDERELDLAIPSWPLEPEQTPLVYTEGELPTLTIQIAPAPQAGGVILLLYTALSTELTGAGVNFTVPDELVPAIKWGVIAEMLSKVGRGADPARAALARERYDLGVAAAQLMLHGFGVPVG